MFSSTVVDPVSTELGYDLLRAEESMARKGTMDAAVFDPLVKVQPEVWSKSIDRVRTLNAVLRSEGCFQGLMGTFWKNWNSSLYIELAGATPNGNVRRLKLKEETCNRNMHYFLGA